MLLTSDQLHHIDGRLYAKLDPWGNHQVYDHQKKEFVPSEYPEVLNVPMHYGNPPELGSNDIMYYCEGLGIWGIVKTVNQ